MISVVAAMLMLAADDAPVFRAAATIYPPFVTADPEDQHIASKDAAKVRCAAARAGFRAELVSGQLKRLEALIRNDRLDAIFTLQQMPTRDEYGDYVPLGTTGRMVWYSRKGHPFDPARKDAPIGAMQADAALHWLEDLGYGRIRTYASHEAMMAGLLAGEVEAVHVAEATSSPPEAMIRLSPQIDEQVSRLTSGGLYVRKAFAGEHPAFIQAFSAALPKCMVATATPDASSGEDRMDGTSER